MDGFQRLIWWLLQSSAGGTTRRRLVRELRREPRNAQQLAVSVGLDYSTVRHHLDVLQKNRLLEAVGERYGQVYFVAPDLESRWAMVDEIEARYHKRKQKE